VPLTTLNVTLSAQLQTDLLQNGSGNGVSAYAVYFNAAGTGEWTPLVLDGVLQSAVNPTSGTASITLPSSMNGGKVYFLVQSQGGTATDLQTAITQESDISWGTADTYSYRYDSIELSLLSAVGDAANLTSVEGFGLPMELSVPETGTRSYKVNATTLFSDFAAATIDTFDGGALGGKSRMAMSPTAAVAIDNNQPFKTSDWLDYINDISEALAGPNPPSIVVNGFFNGAPDLQSGLPAGSVGEWRNAGYFSYHLEWDGTVFWLSPDPTSSQIQGHIRITPEELSQSIYSSLGEVTVYTNKTDTDPYEVYATGLTPSAEMGVGANNQWGKVLQQFTNGFTAGYYQVTGKSLNSESTVPIDLNKNYNWDPTFAFGNNLSSGQPAFMDTYSKVFFDNSNSYGSTYSDALMNAYSAGGPLLPIYANGADVSEINLKIFADDEIPPGYIAPTIANYIAPGGSTYAVPTPGNSGTSSITLNFGSGQGMYLADETQIYFEFLKDYDTNGNPQWNYVLIGGQGASLWQNWTFSADGKSVTGDGGGSATQTPGSLVLTGVPLAASGVSWYRIVVGPNDDVRQKAFNLYATTANSEFVATPSGYAVDGLANVTPGALNPDGSMHTFTVDVTGTTPTLDLSLMQWNTTSTYIDSLVTPTAPVVGTVTAGAFTALSGQSSETPSSSQVIQVDNANVAFGWTGLNSDPLSQTQHWTATYTNKIHGLNTAQVSFLTDAGASTGINPWTATADIDGQWFTLPGSQQLGNGSYQVVMTEYAGSSAVGKTSSPVYINVGVGEIPLAAGSDGKSLTLVPDLSGPDIGGNWVKLAALSSSLPIAATILLYATDGSGQLVARDGHTGPGVTLADAVLGAVGSVPSDAGVTLMEGTQSVYLPIGQKLNFAIQIGDDAPNMAANVVVTPNGDGSFSISVGGVEISAVTENTLSDVEQMASVQRVFNLPMLYLDHGVTLDVETAGSSANTNTLAFVRFDVDFVTHQFSVDGVAYGNTPAFRAAVLANLDGGFWGHHGGQFNDVSTWTVQGETGYYAPVLLTQNGDLFVVGAGNVGNVEYIHSYGANTFAFEDLTAAQGSDFDYNDMIMHISPSDGSSIDDNNAPAGRFAGPDAGQSDIMNRWSLASSDFDYEAMFSHFGRFPGGDLLF